MGEVRFKQVDVFTTERFKGNPVAVVLDADGLSGEQMQQIANWTNLSETTFVTSKTDDAADYRVRIFTPGYELPFAGHPTIGTAHALLEAGVVTAKDGVLIQQCDAGLIRLDISIDANGGRQIAFELPEPEIWYLKDREVDELEAMLGTSIVREFRPCLIDVGARWIVAQFADSQAVLVNRPSLDDIKAKSGQMQATGVVIFGEYPEGLESDIEVRAYAPICGVPEDPVCGSGNGAIAAFIRHTGQTEYFGRFVQASQGAVLGRAGVIHLAIEDSVIRVGGQAITCIDGIVRTCSEG